MHGPLVKVFAPFRLDPINQCLWRNSERIELAPKTFAVLSYLVDHPGRLVTQSELLEALWPETYVQPEILRTYILELRKALGDHAKEPRFIRTFPKRGYQFLASVTQEAAEEESYAAAEKTFVGRETPLSALDRDFENILKSQRQVTFVTGEAGIGKTTVVDAFERKAVRHPGVRVARGQCLEGFGGKEAYYPLLEAVGRLMGGPGGEAIVQTFFKQAPAWLAQFPSRLTDAEQEALQKAIFGATRERMLRELCEALEALTVKEPLILILEDLHWADHSTLDLISAIARRRGPAKLMLLGTFRTVEVILSKSPLKELKQDLLVHRLCNEIALKGLEEESVREYVAGEFPGANVPPGFARVVHRHSGGNPMFMVAIVGELVKNGTTRLPRDLRLGVPETLHQMLDLQIEQLAPAEQRILKCGSVSGQSFSANAVSPLLDMNAPQIEQICEELVKRQQFIQSGTSHYFGGMNSSSHYEFRHALYREALYLQLPPALRIEFHLGLARQLESLYLSRGSSSDDMASELALHFEHSHDYERAAHYLVLSAANAARRFAHRDSVQALAHALALLARVSSEAARKLEIAVLEKLSDAHYAMGEMAESAEADRRVIEMASSLGMFSEQSDALARLARALAFIDPDGCVAVCERAEEICAKQGNPLIHARARLLAACWRVVNNGWNAEDSRICGEAREAIRGLQGTDLPAYYEILYAHVQSIQGEYLDACRTADAGLPESVETRSLVVYLSALSSKTLALLHLGSWGELRRVAQTAIGMAVENGNEPWEGVFRAILAWLSQEATDYNGARRQAAELLKKYTEEPPGQVRTMALLTTSFVDLENGHAMRAVKSFLQIRDRAPYPKFFLQWYWKMIAQLGLASAYCEAGDLAHARVEGDRFLGEALLTADPALKARAWDLQARIALTAGDAGHARECIDSALSVLKLVEPPSAAWRVHWTAAAVCQRLHDRGGADFHQTYARAILRKLAASVDSTDPLRQPLLETAERKLPPPARVRSV